MCNIVRVKDTDLTLKHYLKAQERQRDLKPSKYWLVLLSASLAISEAQEGHVLFKSGCQTRCCNHSSGRRCWWRVIQGFKSEVANESE